MARMFPEHFPDHLADEPGRRAERDVYQALERLDDAHTVYYRVHWHAKTGDHAPADGEGDFIVAHRDLGLLALEVKGGAISYDARTQAWHSRSLGGAVHQIKDPVEQAVTTKHWLVNELKRRPALQRRWLAAGHAVVFPDTRVPDRQLKPDLPRVLVVDADDLDDTRATVRGLYEHFSEPGRRGDLGSDGMKILDAMLHSSFELRSPLGVELDRDVTRLIQLTTEQFRLLGWLGPRRRALIQGCAGSGKTMLAVEKARRLADQGLAVLLTCYNEPLGRHLGERAEGFAATHFHGLCRCLVAEAGITMAEPAGDQNEFFRETLPNAALDALDTVATRYDAIIVDEGQDFDEGWWLVLESLLHEPSEERVLYVFYDDNQNIYRRPMNVPGLEHEEPFALDTNCRNTRRVHDFAAAFHSARERLTCHGPEGRPVEVVRCADDADQLRQARKLLHRLVKEDEVPARDLVILTPRSRTRTGFTHGSTLGPFELADGRPDTADAVEVSSIYRFKGLERKVVILAEIDTHTGGELASLLYVGASRAQAHLVVLAGADLPNELDAS